MGSRSLLQAGSARSHLHAPSWASTGLRGSALSPKARPLQAPRSLPLGPLLPSQNLSVDKVTTLLGQNVGDLQKARSHPAISSWLRSLNRSALGELGLDTDPSGPSGPSRLTTTIPNTIPWAPHLATTSRRPGKQVPTSGTAPHPVLPLGGASPGLCLALSAQGLCRSLNCYLYPIFLANSLSICLLGDIRVTLASPCFIH